MTFYQVYIFLDERFKAHGPSCSKISRFGICWTFTHGKEKEILYYYWIHKSFFFSVYLKSIDHIVVTVDIVLFRHSARLWLILTRSVTMNIFWKIFFSFLIICKNIIKLCFHNKHVQCSWKLHRKVNYLTKTSIFLLFVIIYGPPIILDSWF